MATGGIDKAGDTIMTRSQSGIGKPVDYKQMAQGNFGGATWDGREFDTDRSGESDTVLYNAMKTDADPFLGTGNPLGVSQQADLDFQLAAENEELLRLKRQLEGAKKEEELLKKRAQTDDLRRKIAAQQKTNGRLRGMPNSIQTESKHAKGIFLSNSDSEIDIGTLRKSKKLRKAVRKDMKKLGLAEQSSSDDSVDSEIKVKDSSTSAGILRKGKKKKAGSGHKSSAESELSLSYDSSDSSSDSSSRSKKKKKNKKIKSGIRAKASDKVHFPQKYPQAYLKYEFACSNISFEKLDFNLFVAGELEIIGTCSSKAKEVERTGRLNLLKKIMYLSTSYDFKTLKSYYAACLNEIEIGLKTWKDDFQQIESAILSKHIPKQSSQSSKKFPNKGKDDSEKKAAGEKVWFCALYNRNKCPHKTSHTERRQGRFLFAHHICATCWQKDEKKLDHPECSTACPHSKM